MRHPMIHAFSDETTTPPDGDLLEVRCLPEDLVLRPGSRPLTGGIATSLLPIAYSHTRQDDAGLSLGLLGLE